MNAYQRKQQKRAAAAKAGPQAARLTGKALASVRDRLLTGDDGKPVAGPAERRAIERTVAVEMNRRGWSMAEPGQALRMLAVVLAVRDQKRKDRRLAKEARLPLSALDEAIVAEMGRRLDARVKVREPKTPPSLPLPGPGDVVVEMGDFVAPPLPPEPPPPEQA